MEQEWSRVSFDVLPYMETDMYMLKSPDDVSQLLEDHIVTMQSMSSSPFKKSFEDRISTWESRLTTTRVATHTHTNRNTHMIQTNSNSNSTGLVSLGVIIGVSCCAAALFWWLQEVLEEWLACQRSWLYLEPVFSADDVSQQLPAERQQFQSMERRWKQIMKRALSNHKVRGQGSRHVFRTVRM